MRRTYRVDGVEVEVDTDDTGGRTICVTPAAPTHDDDFVFIPWMPKEMTYALAVALYDEFNAPLDALEYGG